MFEAIKSFIQFLIYPLWLTYATLTDRRHTGTTKFLGTLFSLVVLLPIWVGGYVFVSLAGWFSMQYVGWVKTEIPVSGSSMAPTLDESGMVPVRHYPHFQKYPWLPKQVDLTKLEPPIKRGDIVVFRNAQTTKVLAEQHAETHGRGGFVKRVIGMPGDKVTIRNGFVYLNGEFLEEKYILKARSTFGGDTMRDCNEIVVPSGRYLVMGDNRKVSLDSRHIGLISKKEIQYYLPYDESEKTYGSRWRDPSRDQETAFASELDIDEYVKLLNERRKEKNREPLKIEAKLSKTAERRAKKMLEFDDLSFEATRSGYTMEDAFKDEKYSNIVYGEFPVLGYYDAKELIDSFFEYPDSRDFLLNKDYEEIGLSTFVGELNHCPVQIVVQHLAGYVPPNYSTSDIDEWKNLRTKLGEIKGGWEDLAEDKQFYEDNKKDIDRINTIIKTRMDRAAQLIKRMEANEWFTTQEEKFVDDDKELFQEQNDIADRINKRLQGESEP